MVTSPLCISQIFIFCTNEMIFLMLPLPRAYWQKQLKSESASPRREAKDVLRNFAKFTEKHL